MNTINISDLAALVILTGCAMLAGCSESPAPVDVKPDAPKVTQHNTNTTPSSPPAFSGIPATFHGHFDATLADCESTQPDSDMFLRISATKMAFYEWSGITQAVLSNADGSVTVLSRSEGEGESWTVMNRLLLSTDGNTLTVTRAAELDVDQQDVDRVRCPQ